MEETLEKIISEITMMIVETNYDEYDSSINYGISRLGKFVNADRVYIFEYNFDTGVTNNTFEWCNEGIVPMIKNLQGIPLDEISWWVDKHINGKEIYIYDVVNHTDDKVKEILQPQGVKSLLTIPLFNRGICTGFLGLDSVLDKKKYSLRERDVLIKFGKTLMFLINKIRLEQDLVITKNRLTEVLDSQKELICTFDGAANVVYVNKSFRSTYGKIAGIDIGTNLKNIFKEDSDNELLDLWNRLKNKENHLHYESAVYGENKAQRWISWEIYLINDSRTNVLYQSVGHDITERIELHKLQENYTNQLKTFSEQVPGVIYQYRLKPNGSSCFPMSSAGIWDVYEVRPEDVIEDGSIVFERIHQDDLEYVRESISESKETMKEWIAEYRVVLPQKGLRWVKGIARPEREQDGSILWHGYLTDNTNEILAKERIHESEERLRLAMEATDAGLWDWDMVANTVNYSAKWKTMLGYDEDEFNDSPDEWMKLWHPDDADNIKKAMKSYLDEVSDRYEIIHRLKHKSGHYRWIMTRGSTLLNENGTPIRWIGTNIDISESKAMEIQLNDSNKLLQTAVEDAQNAYKIKSQFLANISHEIRTPMNSILGFSYLLGKDQNLTPAQKVNIDMIVTSGEHLLEMINDLLDLSMIESGRLVLNISEFDIRSLLDEVGTILFQGAIAKNIVFDIYSNDMDYTVKGDKTKLRQILLNLGGNAIKFTESGSVKITASGKRNKERNIAAVFEVIDTGDGIDRNEIPKIFELFYNNNKGMHVKGTGLGLPLSKKFAELMGGDIEVESIIGQGSVFKVAVDMEIVDIKSDAENYKSKMESQVYQKASTSRTKHPDHSGKNTGAIPAGILEKILEYTLAGDVRSVSAEIERIRKFDDYLYLNLIKLLDDFDYEGIIKALGKA